jgi:hypothetical protein
MQTNLHSSRKKGFLMGKSLIRFMKTSIKYKFMAIEKLDKDISDKINFISFIIPECARAYKMNVHKAYQYLKKYGGIDCLNKHWWALHTDNPFWAVRSMYEICHKNGGMR